MKRWTAAGIRLVSVLDPDYPVNLRAVHDRPALLFLRGELLAADQRSVAIVGSRHPPPDAVKRAERIASELARDGYVITSGLAAGIDAAAHRAALTEARRTIAVIGTGVDRAYPPQLADLQRAIANSGAVVSRLWPDDPPSRRTFPARNALMSGLTLATVVVEASERSGTRIQARRALAQGRPVFLHPALMRQAWAQTLAERPNVHVAATAAEIAATIDRARVAGPLRW